MHPLLLRSSRGDSGQAAIHCDLEQAGLAFLRDHEVGCIPWAGPARKGTRAASLPGLGCCIHTPTLCSMQVQGQGLVPAAFMFEMACAAARMLVDQPGAAAPAPSPLLNGISIPAPLLLGAPSTQLSMVSCLAVVADGGLQVRSAWGLHMKASISSTSTHRMSSMPRAAVGAGSARQPYLLPSQFMSSGSAGRVVVAQLAAHGFGHGAAAEYLVHPATLDSSIHAGAVLGLPTDPADTAKLSVPAGLRAFAAPCRLGANAAWAVAGNVTVHVDQSATSDCLAASELDHGSSAVHLHELHSRPMRAGAPLRAGAAAQRLLYQVQWLTVEPTSLQRQHGTSGQASSHGFGRLAWIASQPGKTPVPQLQPAAGSPGAAIISSIAWLQASAPKLAGWRVGLHAAASAAEYSSDISGGSRQSAAHSLSAAGAAGLVRTVAREHAGSNLYSLFSSRYSSAPPVLHSPGLAADAYGVVAESGALRLPRLFASPAEDQQHARAAPPAGLTGRVLVTGGLGELGLLVGTWLAQQPDVHAVLLGRTAHSKRLSTALQAANSLAAVFSTAMADVGSGGDMMAIAADSSYSSQPRWSLMHAGGQLADAMLAGQTAARARAVLAPKLHGSQLLLQLAFAAPLQQAALFSSTAALIGPAGQANYAAANAVLGALAAEQQARGRSSTSIMWGAWSVGMAGRDAALSARINSSGMGLIAPTTGLRTLADTLRRHASFGLLVPAALVATPFNWPRLQQAARGAVPPMFQEFGVESAEGAAHQPALLEHRTAKTAPVLAAQLAGHISGLVLALLGTQVRHRLAV